MGDALRGREIPGDADGIAGTSKIAGSHLGTAGDDNPIDYWRSGRGLSNITPQGKAWPEGEGFRDFLSGLIGLDTVLEFGCGIGRLAPCFDPEQYVGVDVSPFALERARSNHPKYRFDLIGETDPLPLANITLAHTVLLHVPDDALGSVVARFESTLVIVSEILGRHWRRSGNPPVFNRELEDYQAAFAPRYRLVERHEWPYPHYGDTNLTVMKFVRC